MHFEVLASHAPLRQLESTLHVCPSPTPMQVPEALQTRPPLSVHAVPAEACAVPQQPIVHVLVRQRVGGEGQSLGIVHEGPPSQAGDPSLVAESAAESGPTLASESAGEPSLLAESASESGPTLASESPGEPSLLAESASESGPTLVPESLGEPELLDEPLLLDETPLLDPELPPELEVLPLPDPDPELPLEEEAVASPPASSPSGGLDPELPQLAATKRATAVAKALVSCLGVGIERNGMAHLVAYRPALVNPWRERRFLRDCPETSKKTRKGVRAELRERDPHLSRPQRTASALHCVTTRVYGLVTNVAGVEPGPYAFGSIP
jgi:hypothetical protein